MARHAAKKNRFKTATGGLVVTSLAATPLALMPMASFGTGGVCGTQVTIPQGSSAAVRTLSNDVCEISFTAGTTTIEIPAWATKVSTVAVGGGGGASIISGVFHAGGGGQWISVDDLDLTDRELTVSVGAGGAAGAAALGGDGANSSVQDSTSNALITALGGTAGETSGGKAGNYRVFGGGSSATLRDNFGAMDTNGAGTKADASVSSGGPGVMLKYIRDDVAAIDGGYGLGLSYLDQNLWSVDSELIANFDLFDDEFGKGGTSVAGPGTFPELPVPGSGWGGSVKGTGTDAGARAGSSGIVIMRFALPDYTVNFNANGGDGSMSAQTGAFTSSSLTSNSFSRSGFDFAGWNTAADGSGTAYADGASYGFGTNLTLYAQWVSSTPPAPTPYMGPIPVRLDISCAPAGITSTATLTGERLTGITAATIEGKVAKVTDVSATSLTLEIPALAAGTYDVTYQSSSGSITQQSGLRVCVTQSTPPATTPGSETGSNGTEVTPAEESPLYVYKRFTNYRGDRGGVVEADRRAITAFIRANPGLTHVTCVGSTSGVPAIETDPALAAARANNACDIVESLVPGVTTTIKTNVGLGVGQFFRAVTLFGKGTKP
jgi:uncharacterized repeat protein (TIGR02543 family)